MVVDAVVPVVSEDGRFGGAERGTAVPVLNLQRKPVVSSFGYMGQA